MVYQLISILREILLLLLLLLRWPMDAEVDVTSDITL